MNIWNSPTRLNHYHRNPDRRVVNHGGVGSNTFQIKEDVPPQQYYSAHEKGFSFPLRIIGQQDIQGNDFFNNHQQQQSYFQTEQFQYNSEVPSRHFSLSNSRSSHNSQLSSLNAGQALIQIGSIRSSNTNSSGSGASSTFSHNENSYLYQYNQQQQNSEFYPVLDGRLPTLVEDFESEQETICKLTDNQSSNYPISQQSTIHSNQSQGTASELIDEQNDKSQNSNSESVTMSLNEQQNQILPVQLFLQQQLQLPQNIEHQLFQGRIVKMGDIPAEQQSDQIDVIYPGTNLNPRNQ